MIDNVISMAAFRFEKLKRATIKKNNQKKRGKK